MTMVKIIIANTPQVSNHYQVLHDNGINNYCKYNTGKQSLSSIT